LILDTIKDVCHAKRSQQVVPRTDGDDVVPLVDVNES
jgi:hypothetical protein